MAKVNPYIGFNGNCEEAFKFYEQNLGGKVEVFVRYEETPAGANAPADFQKKIIHARVRIGDTILMGADAPAGHYKKPQGVSVILSTTTPAEADRFFLALAERGKVSMPIEKTFFSPRFGMLTDAFDVPWMIICEEKT